MTRLTIALAAVVTAGCSSTTPAPGPSPAAVPAPAAVTAGTMYTRIPGQIGTFKLTERAIVRGVPTDSLFRFRDSSRTNLTVIIYEVSANVRMDADSQKWTWYEGEKFKLVQQILRERRAIADFATLLSDSTRFEAGARRVLEHWTIVRVKQNTGATVVEFQYLYLIDGKFLKARATIPHEGWQDSKVPAFARQLARTVAGGTP